MKWKVGFALCLRRRANNSFLLPSCEGGGVWQMHNCLPTSSYSPTPPTPAPARKATQTILPQNGREKNKLGRNSQFSFAFLLCSVPSVRFPLIYTKKKIRDIRWRVVKNIPALSRQNFPSSSSSSSPIPKLGKTPAR